MDFFGVYLAMKTDFSTHKLDSPFSALALHAGTTIAPRQAGI
jgi:hypothetical protein